MVFKGPQCVVEFLEYLEELAADDTQKVTVIAHNFQGYDGYFVINEYHGRNQLIQQLRNGAKILQLKHDSIRFIDSVNFIAGKLSNFTKTFGLTELKKGYFPHLFNRPENQDYVGEVPAMDYYMVESMSPKDYKTFKEWHAKQRQENYVFDFQKELEEYCISDVKLSRLVVCSFVSSSKEKPALILSAR